MWLEGSNELGSVHPSFHPSVFLLRSFLRIGSLIFSETQHGDGGPSVVLCEKMGKMGQK